MNKQEFKLPLGPDGEMVPVAIKARRRLGKRGGFVARVFIPGDKNRCVAVTKTFRSVAAATGMAEEWIVKQLERHAEEASDGAEGGP